MLLQILELLADVHEQGQVIGSLGPSRIVWFSAEHAWKLLDLCEFSAQRRRTLPSVHLGVRYTAPEIVLSESREGAKTVPESPSDMWSFGVMLLEMVLPGAFRDPLPSMESIISCVQGRAWSIQTRVREPTDASPCQDRSLGVSSPFLENTHTPCCTTCSTPIRSRGAPHLRRCTAPSFRYQTTRAAQKL